MTGNPGAACESDHLGRVPARQGEGKQIASIRAARWAGHGIGWWHQGWTAVGIGFGCLTLSAGFGFYSLSAYTAYLVAHRGLTLTAATAGSTIFLLSSSLAGLPVARLVERYGVRRVLAAGTIGFALTLAVLGLAGSVWQVWLAYAVLGAAAASVSAIPVTVLVLRWFPQAPGRPLALATTGMSVGGALVAPFVAVGVNRAGLVPAAIVMAVILLAVMLPLSLLADRDTSAASEAVLIADQAPASPPDGTAPPGARRLVFAMLGGAIGLQMLGQVAVLTSVVPLAIERHIPAAPAALSIMAGASVAGRLAGIAIMPRISLRAFRTGNALLQALGMIAVALAGEQGALLASAALFGLTVGNTFVTLPLSMLDSFGGNGYPRRFARANLITSLGVALAPLTLGYLHQVAGGYRPPMLALAASTTAAALALALVPRRNPRSPAIRTAVPSVSHSDVAG